MIKSITKESHGMRCICTIEREEIKDAKISIDAGNRIYICQNEKDGARCNDTLGYKYSWNVGTLGRIQLEDNDVHDFKIIVTIEDEKTKKLAEKIKDLVNNKYDWLQYKDMKFAYETALEDAVLILYTQEKEDEKNR